MMRILPRVQLIISIRELGIEIQQLKDAIKTLDTETSQYKKFTDVIHQMITVLSTFKKKLNTAR